MPEHPLPDAGTCLRDGWLLYKQEPLLLSGATILMGIICGVAGMIPFAGALVYPPLLGGLYSMIIRLERGEAITINNLFDGFQVFLPLIIASFLMSLFIGIGVFLFILPGLYLLIVYGFTNLMIIDQKMDFWPAMEASRKLIHAHFWSYGLLALVIAVICVAASIPLGLGLIVAAPVCLAAQYRFYRALNFSEDPSCSE
ncbi:membrane protein [Congregibacter litoralis]|uniref:Uncharacterized protein family n=1 Tax=Congregibacter litoralis KT71 TaxID=314285 RepID=A4AD72_9GAMM|nr:membrane protein [Congregibacter litoralis]EAQ95996.1 Uncharacterized protein family [Congregibacter litoralis KT71]